MVVIVTRWNDGASVATVLDPRIFNRIKIVTARENIVLDMQIGERVRERVRECLWVNRRHTCSVQWLVPPMLLLLLLSLLPFGSAHTQHTRHYWSVEKPPKDTKRRVYAVCCVHYWNNMYFVCWGESERASLMGGMFLFLCVFLPVRVRLLLLFFRNFILVWLCHRTPAQDKQTTRRRNLHSSCYENFADGKWFNLSRCWRCRCQCCSGGGGIVVVDGNATDGRFSLLYFFFVFIIRGLNAHEYARM